MPSTSVHGTPDYAELAALGLTPDQVVYFSSNINPYGPPDSVVEAVSAAVTRETISLYPDSLSLSLRARLAEYHQLPVDALMVGNGTADLIWLIAQVFGRRKQVAILSPTFSEYEDGVVMAAGHPTGVVLPGWQRLAPDHFAPGPSTLEQCHSALKASSPWLVFLCNPNNPTGETLRPQELRYLRKAAPNALWVIDEAYVEFSEDPWSVSEWVLETGWIVLRSLTKDFALGGLRLGYLLAAPSIVERLIHVQPPWSVNGLAQIAGEAALEEIAWRDGKMETLRRSVIQMQKELVDLGFRPVPTTVNYFLLPVGDGATVRRKLLAKKLIVRDCASFGLPEYIRIAVQKPEENQQLIDALGHMN